MAGGVTPEAAMGAVMQIMDRVWSWGEADCCTAACSVYASLFGSDPMASLRGRYTGARGAAEAVAAAGGWDALCADLAALAGMVEVVPAAAPVGAIGLTAPGIDGAHGRALSIHVGGLWAAKTPRGFALLPGVSRAWA